eukprot:5133492-Pyramimonas_sp.AAC.1
MTSQSCSGWPWRAIQRLVVHRSPRGSVRTDVSPSSLPRSTWLSDHSLGLRGYGLLVLQWACGS